jgi:hypothetical protein
VNKGFSDDHTFKSSLSPFGKGGAVKRARIKEKGVKLKAGELEGWEAGRLWGWEAGRQEGVKAGRLDARTGKFKV